MLCNYMQYKLYILQSSPPVPEFGPRLRSFSGTVSGGVIPRHLSVSSEAEAAAFLNASEIQQNAVADQKRELHLSHQHEVIGGVVPNIKFMWNLM